MRTVQGLLALARRLTCEKVDRACKTALGFDAYRLKHVKALVNTKQEQAEFKFMSEHPVIRNMNEYGRVVRVEFRKGKGDVVDISATRHTRRLRGETGEAGGSSEGRTR